MTAPRHDWHLEHLTSLNELVAEYLRVNPGRLPARSTITDLVNWAWRRVQEPVNEPAVCSHCGEPCGDGHTCASDVELRPTGSIRLSGVKPIPDEVEG